MRATYASESIAAGVGSDELARVMGTGVAMIEEHYGVVPGGAVAAIAARQDAYDADQDRAINASLRGAALTRLVRDWSRRTLLTLGTKQPNRRKHWRFG